MPKWILRRQNSSLGADMAHYADALFDLPQSSFDATHMRYFETNLIRFVFTGTGIKLGRMGGDTFVKDGHINSLEMQIAGNSVMSVTRLSLPAERLDDLIGGGNLDNLLAFLTRGADTIIGTALKDVMFGSGGNDDLFGGKENDQLFGGTERDRLYGGTGNDPLLAGPGDDASYGGDGNDVLLSDTGNDRLFGGSGIDNLDAAAGNDIAFGGADGDTLNGFAGKDQLYGGSGADDISGGFGADRLYGGAGQDDLYGGAGKDQFVFDMKPGSATLDNVHDFEVNIDKIVLDEDVFTKLGGPGQLAASRFGLGTNAGDPSDRIIYDTATGLLSYDRDGRGGAEAVVIAQMTAGLLLNAGDFRVIG
jgi:Ca2+-binding RTX toxin-like protein